MSETEIKTWQTVQAEVRRRIYSREWKPGDFIPNEADLSVEFGCARATVNRALRNLAEAGILDRKRKAGTQVALHPVRKATLNIPVIRREVEGNGQTHQHRVLSQALKPAPAEISALMKVKTGEKLLHLVTLHLADHKPFVFEDRWINPEASPEIATTDFTDMSPNEWLVVNIPFEGGDFSFCAMAAGAREAEILGCSQGDALFVIDRITRAQTKVITSVRVAFAPGYQMHTEI